MGTRENARARFDRCLRESDKILSDLMAARPDLAGELRPAFWQAPTRPEGFAPDESVTTRLGGRTRESEISPASA